MQFELNFRSHFVMGGELEFPVCTTGTDRDNHQTYLRTQHRDKGDGS